jgi:hypothetical protein
MDGHRRHGSGRGVTESRLSVDSPSTHRSSRTFAVRSSDRLPPNLVGIALTITEPLPFAGDADDPED